MKTWTKADIKPGLVVKSTADNVEHIQIIAQVYAEGSTSVLAIIDIERWEGDIPTLMLAEDEEESMASVLNGQNAEKVSWEEVAQKILII